MIKAEIVADSISPQGERLTSLLITFPRIILAEINTHRMLSKNTSSSRAIPFKKMVEAVQENPFIPIAWQKAHSGMQGSEYITDEKQLEDILANYDNARNAAINRAEYFTKIGVTKQIANRLLEPFMWTTMLITGSKEGWDNFFELRNPNYQIKITKPEELSGKTISFESKKDFVKFGNNEELTKDWTDLDWLYINKGQAEIHIMDLAEKIYDAMNESTPKQLKAGEWHIPFEDRINKSKLEEAIFDDLYDLSLLTEEEIEYGAESANQFIREEAMIKISTAMAARTSYTVVGNEKEINYERMIELHDRLIAQDPPHSSPMEHCARAMSDKEFISYFRGELPKEDKELTYSGRHGWCRNFIGFIPYRHFIESE